MADEKVVSRWDTTGYRVVPQPDRGGDAFTLTLAADDAALEWARDPKPPRKGAWVRVRAGQIADRIPAATVAWLLKRGYIAKTEKKPVVPETKPVARKEVAE